MDPSFIAHILLVWMMLSMSKSNSLSCKSQVWEILDLDSGPSMSVRFLPLLFLLASRKKPHAACNFWVEPRQAIHWNYVERVVWRASDEMHERKCKKFYRMSYPTFKNLLQLLTPFLRSEYVNQVRPQLEIKKIVAFLIYRLAHGHSLNHMADRFKVGASTIRKYVDIVCDILTNREKLFSHYIAISSGDRLHRIINDFEKLTNLLNICGAIDGTYILLVERPSKRIILAESDFYYRKKFHSIILQGFCNSKKIFWNVCVGQPCGMHDGEQFKLSSLYRQLRYQEILQDPLVVVGGMRCTPYLIADSAFPICPYLMKN